MFAVRPRNISFKQSIKGFFNMRHLIIIALLSTSLAACGSKNETTLTDADGKKVTFSADDNGKDATIKTADGTMTATSGSSNIPFPAAAPQYPGATVTGSMNFDASVQGKGIAKNITLETSDPIAQVGAFYKAKMTAANMPISSEMNSPESFALTSGDGTKGTTLSVMASSENGKTSIIVSQNTK
jgi:predicted small lipoprotein YifL